MSENINEEIRMDEALVAKLDKESSSKQFTSHEDADGAVFFEGQLKAIKAKTYDVIHSDLKAMSVIPVDTDYDPGAETIEYRSYDSVGMAKFVADYANDFPRVDIIGTSKSVKPRDMGASFGYSFREVKRANMGNFPLEQRRARACKRAIDELQNSVAFKGDSATGLKGLFNITGANIATHSVGKKFSAMSASELISVFTTLIQCSGNLTNGKEVPDTVLMPYALANRCKATEVSSGYPKSVWQYLHETFSEITLWETIPELKGGSSITSGRDMCVAYKRDVDKVELAIPEAYTTHNPEQKGLTVEIKATQRTAGVIAFYPMSVTYLEEGA